MLKKTSIKVPNGKLLTVSYDVQNNKIRSVQITGDFFMYPEEGIYAVERILQGISMDRIQIRTALQKAILKDHIYLYGLTVDSIVDALFI
jgi:lipoate-protein ligase A